MGDPRNVAHAKKVSQEKHHKEKHAPKAEAQKPIQPVEPTQVEKSLVVLSKLKELEFHSRANIEKLAELSLTIEEELKQKPFCRGYWRRLLGA